MSGKRGLLIHFPFTSVKGTVLSPLDTRRTFRLIRIFPIRCLRYVNSDLTLPVQVRGEGIILCYSVFLVFALIKNMN